MLITYFVSAHQGETRMQRGSHQDQQTKPKWKSVVRKYIVKVHCWKDWCWDKSCYYPARSNTLIKTDFWRMLEGGEGGVNFGCCHIAAFYYRKLHVFIPPYLLLYFRRNFSLLNIWFYAWKMIATTSLPIVTVPAIESAFKTFLGREIKTVCAPYIF